MKYRSVLLLTFLLSSLSLAECLVPVQKSLLILVEDARGAYYALPKEHVDFVLATPNHCIDAQLGSTQMDVINSLTATLTEYKTMADQMEADLLKYKEMNQELLATLDQSVSLTGKYDGLLTDYDALSEEYSMLANRYDDLAGVYRDIAMSTHSLFTVDAGIGLNVDANPIGLLGIGYKKLNLWGIAGEGSSGLVIGTSVPF